MESTQNLPNGQGEHFIEYVPQQLESFRCALHPSQVCCFLLFSPQLTNNHSGAFAPLKQCPGLLSMCAMLRLWKKFQSLFLFPIFNFFYHLTQQQGKRRWSHFRVHSKRAHLVSFHFSWSQFFFSFSPTHSAYWTLWQVAAVKSRQVVLEIAKFIGTSPNVSCLKLSLVCSTSLPYCTFDLPSN